MFLASIIFGYAIKHDDRRVMKLLLSSGLDPNYRHGNICAFTIAIRAENTYAVKLLLVGGKPTSTWLFKEAIDRNLIEIVSLLIDGRLDPSANNNYALQRAAHLGRIEILLILLKDVRVEVNDDPLLLAARFGRKEALCMLMTVHAPVNIKQMIVNASMYGHVKIVCALMKSLATDTLDNTAITAASLFGHIDVVKKLLQYPQVDPAGINNNVIVCAAGNGKAGVLKLLLKDSRVDPGVEDDLPFRSAVLEGRVSTTRLLLDVADIKNVKTSLGYAYRLNWYNLMDMLLDRLRYRADIDYYIVANSIGNGGNDRNDRNDCNDGNKAMYTRGKSDKIWKSHMLKYYIVIKELVCRHLVIDLLPMLL